MALIGLSSPSGAVTVHAGQTLTITGQGAPVGQLALIDAAISVLDGGVAELRSLHLVRRPRPSSSSQLRHTRTGLAREMIFDVLLPCRPSRSRSSPAACSGSSTAPGPSTRRRCGAETLRASATSCRGRPLTCCLPLCSADRPRPQVLRIPTAPADQLPECTAEKGPSMVATMNTDLGMEVVQMCMDKGGTAQWRPVVTSGGVIYDGAPCFGCPLCRRCC